MMHPMKQIGNMPTLQPLLVRWSSSIFFVHHHIILADYLTDYVQPGGRQRLPHVHIISFRMKTLSPMVTYIGCLPVFPAMAISIRMLAIFRQAHCTCLCFSIHAQCKTLCHLHDVRPVLISAHSILNSELGSLSTLSFQTTLTHL